MAKAKKRRKSKSMTIPLGVVVPLGAVAIDAWEYGRAWGGYNYKGMADRLLYGMTGYSYLAGNWRGWRMQYGLLPIGVGYMVHKVATKLGVNRALASAGVPWIRI